MLVIVLKCIYSENSTNVSGSIHTRYDARVTVCPYMAQAGSIVKFLVVNISLYI